MDVQAKRSAFVSLLLGTALALLPWGLELMGVAVNPWLGAAVLVAAFALLGWSFWLWPRTTAWPTWIRAATLLVASVFYFYWIGARLVESSRIKFTQVLFVVSMDDPGGPIRSLHINNPWPEAILDVRVVVSEHVQRHDPESIRSQFSGEMVHVGTLAAHATVPIGVIRLSEEDAVDSYQITMITTNGRFTQMNYFRKRNIGGWAHDWSLLVSGTRKVLKEIKGRD
ncbi:MAG: hypothetical protein HY647_07255 [Acidobacteria bacterium]|nr:hypothetical protein [Acidobacteriota bacterium]